MVKKAVSGPIAELQKSVEKLIIGVEETVKMLRQGKVQKVFLSSNCESGTRENVERYCKIAGVECVVLEQSNEDLGVVCRKPYVISVVGISA